MYIYYKFDMYDMYCIHHVAMKTKNESRPEAMISDTRNRSVSSSSESVNNLTVGKNSTQALSLTKKRLEVNDSEDDFNDESVNLVALEEIASNKYSKLGFIPLHS